MIIDIYDNGLIKEDVKDIPQSIACRGVIEKDGKYLVVNLAKYDITTFPGGGLEENETWEECCEREVLEETGIKCVVIEKTIEVNEYFEDTAWKNVYFKCKFIEDTGKANYTEEEISLKMQTEWRSLAELLDTFENNMTLHEFGPNIHNREFLGLIHSV